MPLQHPKQAKSHAESKRKTERLPTYLSDGIRGRVTIGKDTLPVSLIDITPFGVGVVPDTDLPERVRSALKPGALVHFQYTSRNTSSTKLKALIAHLTTQTIQGEHRLTFGLAFLSDESSSSRTLRRKTERFECSEFFRPNALCGSPYFFGERAFFGLTDISSSGCSAITSARNKFLSPNMEVSLTISFPLVGTINVDAIVRAVSLRSKGTRYQINLEFKQTTSSMLQTIGEYLMLVNPKLQPEELRRAGLRLSKLSNVISVSTPRSREDWDAILNLRKELMQTASSSSSAHSFFDQFDSFSRSLMVKIGERTIATGRILFLNADPGRSEAVFTLGFPWPTNIPLKNTLEVSFPLVSPNYNHSEAFETLMKGYFKIAFENDAHFLLCAAPLSESANMESLGFFATGNPRNVAFRGAPNMTDFFAVNLESLKNGEPAGKMSPSTFKAFVEPILEQCGLKMSKLL
jgi:hypothetical protein